jgi:hypothetical protein
LKFSSEGAAKTYPGRLARLTISKIIIRGHREGSGFMTIKLGGVGLYRFSHRQGNFRAQVRSESSSGRIYS